VREYAELEQILRRAVPGASMREAVTSFIAHHGNKGFEPRTVTQCAGIFVKHQRANNISPQQIETLEKHFRRFERHFGNHKIHEIPTLEISNWLAAQTDERTGRLWNAKTRINNLGSLVSLSVFARDMLRAIPDVGKTEFQKVRRPKPDVRGEVEIYTAEEMEKLLRTALETDIDLIPALVLGGFQGLRPAEFHGESAKRPPLRWDALIWDDGILYITGQKIRSKANRPIPLQPVTEAWLRPFANCQGEIWKYKEAYNKKLYRLCERAGVRRIHDGLRHSYASYRIRPLKGNLPQLAEEMGNSPREIIRSYKRNVTDGEANAWFNVVPPVDYWEVVYTYIQKGVGRMRVNLQKAHFGCSAVNTDSQEIKADLGSLQDLEARGVEPLSSSHSTQTSTCLSGVKF
jgi:hypothetical protein